MKLSIVRSACGSLRIPAARPGGRFSGLSRGCSPVGPVHNRLILRAASASTTGVTNPKIAVNYGKQPLRDDVFECDNSLR